METDKGDKNVQLLVGCKTNAPVLRVLGLPIHDMDFCATVRHTLTTN